MNNSTRRNQFHPQLPKLVPMPAVLAGWAACLIAGILLSSGSAGSFVPGMALAGLSVDRNTKPSGSSRSSLSKILAGMVGIILFLIPFLVPVLWIKVLLLVTFVCYAVLVHLIMHNMKIKEAQQQASRATAAEIEKTLAEAQKGQKELLYTEKVAAISKFSSVVSHELRNPLASLKNIAYYLTRAIKFEDERTKKMLGMLSEEIDRTNGLIGELTDLSHAKRLNKTMANLEELAQVSLSAITLKEGIALTKDIEKIEANVDPEKIKLILHNLIKNSQEAMPNGGAISLRIKKAGENVELFLQDTGIGMDQETQDHMFDPIFSTKTKALGLGLTVVKEIVSMHNGQIAVQSEKDKGTAVTITLPL
jgi:signal transduction histidine kinase